MEEQNILDIRTRNEFRQWLETHHTTEKACWVCVKRGRPTDDDTFWYIDAVEEALCFGWIDSTIRHIDPLHRAQHFTPRNPKSTYSRPNIERLIWLDGRGLIHPKVRPSLEHLITTDYVFPGDILKAVRQDPAAWEHYVSFSEPYKRIRIAYIDAARKRPDEFAKRLENFIRKTRENKLIVGYGGIDKYYR